MESVLCFEQCVEFTSKREHFVACYIWWQRWKSGESTMEETVKALETKLAQLEAKIGKKSKSGASTSTSSNGSPETLPLCIKPESFSATSGESWLAWLRKFKSIAALNKWSPDFREEEGASSASYSAFHTSFGPQQGDQEPPPWAKELFQ